MSEVAYELGIVCEARADRETVCYLADRVLLEGIEWLDTAMLETHRRWRGLESHEPHLEWKHLYEEAKRRNLRKGLFGHFNGKPGEPDAHAARVALLLFADTPHRPAAVVLSRDSDGDERRHRGLSQARDAYDWPFQVLIALASPKRECWVLAGFDPRDDHERERLERVRSRLSFHPVHEAHRLSASEHGAKGDAKVALRELLQGDREREAACLLETPLAVLGQRGRLTGLADFLQQVREQLVPVVGGAPSPR